MSDAGVMRYRGFLRQPLRILRIAGLLACVNSGVMVLSTEYYTRYERHNLLEMLLAGRTPDWMNIGLQLVGYSIYAWALWRVTRPEEIASPDKWAVLLVATQILLTVLLFSFDVFYMVAAEVGLLFSIRVGAIWILSQAMIEALAFFSYPQQLSWLYPVEVSRMPRLMAVAMVGFTALTYYFLAYSMGRLGVREERQRRELAALQHMEAESARLSDRLAIARELHDSMGHHLTAISVHLQLASRLVAGEGADSVSESYQLAQALLRDVRGVVSGLRDTGTGHLADKLKAMAASVRVPEVHVEVDSGFADVEPHLNHVLFRCAQETITNAIRHSSARNLWISLRSTRGGYELEARDDGNGASGIHFGNGLNGMRERIENLGGYLGVSSQPGKGFEVLVTIPRKESFVA